MNCKSHNLPAQDCPQCAEECARADLGQEYPETHATARGIVRWTRLWNLDGDIVRCRDCGNGIHISRKAEAIRHHADCSETHGEDYPWQALQALLASS